MYSNPALSRTLNSERQCQTRRRAEARRKQRHVVTAALIAVLSFLVR
jgi:hypothetical protein